MAHAFIFGLGYTGKRVADRLRALGWDVAGTGGDSPLRFDDTPAVTGALARATHIVCTIPPESGLLDHYGALLHDKWLGYLSSTGVYGDAGGGWVDESTPLNGRRGGRIDEDAAWLARGARVFRLPGIYGPGRSALERVASGTGHRIELPGQVFSRVHVDDIVAGVIAGFEAPQGAYNLSDDRPCDQNAVMEEAARLLGVDPPPFVALETLSPQARAFYAENRRVANGKAKRVLGWTPAYPDFVAGLRALSAISNPAIATTPPAAASVVQR
ncbi:NAD(P)-dependent oxidoreductase [Sphingomonas sp. SUN039]|uniref:NAD(P)-dependent oxidoreductase n=1 Tax=Sphingomonas sp. SUN039 TaxID=2937787 RepID=UPI00216458D2|nr:NAD(P)-dependent oxidoreductase [Sphingomonas sp. SUN039]UVO55396.1 NAD(P)-dependent oxidoreductase [Sphingomonas sp. SUN039]